jgi:hypothetical protein
MTTPDCTYMFICAYLLFPHNTIYYVTCIILVLTCTVVVGTTEIPCQFEYSDYILSLVKLTQIHYANDYGGDPACIVGLRNRRSNRGTIRFTISYRRTMMIVLS